MDHFLHRIQSEDLQKTVEHKSSEELSKLSTLLQLYDIVTNTIIIACKTHYRTTKIQVSFFLNKTRYKIEFWNPSLFVFLSFCFWFSHLISNFGLTIDHGKRQINIIIDPNRKALILSTRKDLCHHICHHRFCCAPHKFNVSKRNMASDKVSSDGQMPHLT
jgi:hypothetical protein